MGWLKQVGCLKQLALLFSLIHDGCSPLFWLLVGDKSYF